MREFTYTITAESGIHARPAGLLVKEASSFDSDITIATEEKSGDLKRIFSVMGLGAKQGDAITIRAQGEDQDAAIAALQAFVEENL